MSGYQEEYRGCECRSSKRGSARRNGSGEAARSFGETIGQNRVWREIIRQMEMVAPPDATVLIMGEIGPGKSSLLAGCTNAAAANINRWSGLTALVSLRNYMRTNFFGHAKGAFSICSTTIIGNAEDVGTSNCKIDPNSQCSS
jgi:DNA-binding NtrC family response regulator